MYRECGPQRLSLRAQLALDEVETRWCQSKAAGVRSPGHLSGRLAQGLTAAQVAVVPGDTGHGSRPRARRYHQQRQAGREARRHRHAGATGRRSPPQRGAPAAGGGIGSGPNVAAWMAPPGDAASSPRARGASCRPPCGHARAHPGGCSCPRGQRRLYAGLHGVAAAGRPPRRGAAGIQLAIAGRNPPKHILRTRIGYECVVS